MDVILVYSFYYVKDIWSATSTLLSKKIIFWQICVSSVDPLAFPPAVEAGAQMVWIINLETKLLQKISSVCFWYN